MNRTRFVYNSIQGFTILVIFIYTVLCPILATHGSPQNPVTNSNIQHTVREQFETIESDLKGLEEIFSLSPEETTERLKCKVCNVRIKYFKLRIKEIISQASNTINQNSSETNLKYPDNCKELTKTLLWAIRQLEDLFLKALASDSNLEIAKLIQAYENFHDECLKQRHKIKESLSQKQLLKLDKLETDLKNLRNYLMGELERFDILTVEKCVTEINFYNLDGAIDYLEEVQFNAANMQSSGGNITDVKLKTISKIIRKSFQNGVDKLKTSDYIMYFIQKQSKFNKNKAYEILYSEMVEYSTIEYLTLESSNQLENITVNLCILEVKLGKIQEAFEHFKHLKLISMSQIIQASYDLNSFENIMNFIKKQPDATERNMAYGTLSLELLGHSMSENLESIKINLCVLKILLGQKTEAHKLFNELKTISLEEILIKTNNLYNGVNELQNILAFIHSQKGSYCNILKASKIIITSVIKEWESPKNFEIGAIAVMDLYSRDFLNYSSCINETQDLWVQMIPSNCGLLQFIRLRIFRKTNVTAEDINEYYDKIIGPSIQKALKVENILKNRFEKIFKCSITLSFLHGRSVQLTAVTLSTIFDELKKQNFVNNQNQIAALALIVKKFMEIKEYEKLSEEYKQITENIKWKLPVWTRKMFWQGDKCKLKNRIWGEYLYACGQCQNYSDQQHPVFVGTPKIEAESQWMFNIDVEDGNLTVQNVHTKEFLIAATERPDSWVKLADRRPVLTRKDELPSDSSWKISRASHETDITIQRNGEFLYVDGSDEWNGLGRRVFTSITGKFGRPYENEWELICE
ncbi:uncharacterized protein LOC123293312 [Chrysoperla carnea]|uniref:uncharacterized protein LOC123293312 n=1 Tax=Chrysoperla carnea TaxID=189513 RepID=UPI001D060C71|nr:uncharacterized protein LOC123293312 [Chrysoperla carnea]